MSDVTDSADGIPERPERVQISRRRKKIWREDIVKTDRSSAEKEPNGASECDSEHRWNAVGLAISGGGIRSATFGLGILQGLASLGVLKCVDCP